MKHFIFGSKEDWTRPMPFLQWLLFIAGIIALSYDLFHAIGFP